MNIVKIMLSAALASVAISGCTTTPYIADSNIDRNADRYLSEARQLHADCIVIQAAREVSQSDRAVYGRSSVTAKCNESSAMYFQAVYASVYKTDQKPGDSRATAEAAVRQLNNAAFTAVDTTIKGANE